MENHRIPVLTVAVAIRSAADYCLLVKGGAANSRYGRYCKKSKAAMSRPLGKVAVSHA